MKILLELVPCCGSPTSSRRRSTGPPSPPHDNDDADFTSLVPPPPRTRTKRARKAPVVNPRSGSSSAKWSPSLGVIAEDRAAPTVQRKAAASAADVVGSSRGGGGGGSMGAWSGVPDRERRRRDRDDNEYGRSSLSTTVITAFSPTPLLF